MTTAHVVLIIIGLVFMTGIGYFIARIEAVYRCNEGWEYLELVRRATHGRVKDHDYKTAMKIMSGSLPSSAVEALLRRPVSKEDWE